MRSPIEHLKRRLAVRRLGWAEALKKGEQLLKAGKAAESIPYFRHSLKANPGEYGTANSYKWAQEKLAEALGKTGHNRKAAALLKEMTPAQYWLGVIRASLLSAAFILGGGLVIIFGAMFIMARFFGQEIPAIPVVISRGETTTIDVRFTTPVDISARGATVKPAERYDGLLPWMVRPWEDFENRYTGPRILDRGSFHSFEVVMQGKQSGLGYAIGEPDIVNGYGGSKVIISAHSDTPPGLYKIWLAGAYLDHTRRIARFNPDTIIWQAGPSEKETLPRDAGAGRIPAIEVSVK